MTLERTDSNRGAVVWSSMDSATEPRRRGDGAILPLGLASICWPSSLFPACGCVSCVTGTGKLYGAAIGVRGR